MRQSKTLIIQVSARVSHIALFLALFVGFSEVLVAQKTLQSTLIVVPNPPKKLSDWRTNRDAIQLLITNTGAPTKIKIDAKLSLNGKLIASTKRELIPEIPISNGQTILYGADLISEQAFSPIGDSKQSAIRTGILPEGTYQFCIDLLMAPEYISIPSTEECRQFIISQYLLPQLILPENEKTFVVGMEKLTVFRWSNLIPAPSLPVVYKLRGVEVLPGQSPQQAFVTNTPLFEKKITGMLQSLWPTEVILPSTGITIAWSVQPEDMSGAPYVTPESYPPPFTVRFLPLDEECVTLLEKLKYSIKVLLAMEESYWHEFELVERAEQLQEEAEDRGDAYEVEHWQTKLVVSSQSLESTKERYEAAYDKYEEALEQYKFCIEKPKH